MKRLILTLSALATGGIAAGRLRRRATVDRQVVEALDRLNETIAEQAVIARAQLEVISDHPSLHIDLARAVTRRGRRSVPGRAGQIS